MKNLITKFLDEIFNDKLNIDEILMRELNDNINEIYNDDIYKYFLNYKYLSDIQNINDDFMNNVTNIKVLEEYNEYLLLSCLYNNKKAIIKLFYNPIINFDLLYEQIIYTIISKNNNEKYNFYPKVYNLGYIDLNILLNDEVKNELINYINNIYQSQNNLNYEIIDLFKKSFHNLIHNNDDINFNFLNYYINSKNNLNTYICNLLIYFKNKLNKHIHVIILENYIDESSYNFYDFYKKNLIDYTYTNDNLNKYITKNNNNNNNNNNNDNVSFNNIIYLIIYKIFNCIELLNNEFNIIHNNILLNNIYIIENETNNTYTYRCVIINYNMSYMKNINNLSLYKYNNIGIKNELNYMKDYFAFINNFINLSYDIGVILKPYNFFTYNNPNLKILDKILFKKNKQLRDLIFKNHILYINKINSFFCDNIIFKNNIEKYHKYPNIESFNNKCITPNITKFNTKYLLKYLIKHQLITNN